MQASVALATCPSPTPTCALRPARLAYRVPPSLSGLLHLAGSNSTADRCSLQTALESPSAVLCCQGWSCAVSRQTVAARHSLKDLHKHVPDWCLIRRWPWLWSWPASCGTWRTCGALPAALCSFSWKVCALSSLHICGLPCPAPGGLHGCIAFCPALSTAWVDLCCQQ